MLQGNAYRQTELLAGGGVECLWAAQESRNSSNSWGGCTLLFCAGG